jgi:hypothetical protein
MLLARKKIDYSTKEASKSTSVRKNIFFNLSTNIFLIRTLHFAGISPISTLIRTLNTTAQAVKITCFFIQRLITRLVT